MQLWHTHANAYLGLGSNLGDRAGNLLMAVRGLREASFEICKLSAVYETEPVGLDTDKAFLNMVAEVRVTDVTPSQMMARLLRIEYNLGRGDKSIKRPRTADLDILFFGDQQLTSEFVTIPHPRVHLRRFVLIPMQEIAPEFVDPASGKTITQLLDECEDDSWVHRWDPNAGLLGSSAEIEFAQAVND